MPPPNHNDPLHYSHSSALPTVDDAIAHRPPEHTTDEADTEERQNLDLLGGIPRLEAGNADLLQRVVALEQTIIANQRAFAQVIPGLEGLAEAPPDPME